MITEAETNTTRPGPPSPLRHAVCGATAHAIMAVLTALFTATSAGAAHRTHRQRAKVVLSSDAGSPITTTNGIRINALGEVVSKPIPVIEKERKFNERALKELMKTHSFH